MMTDIPPPDAKPNEWNKAHKAFSGTSRWPKFYDAYLQSVAWSNKRVEVFEEKGVRCAYCDDLAYQVHHKSYENVGQEKLKDLEPICESCHEEIHS